MFPSREAATGKQGSFSGVDGAGREGWLETKGEK